MSRKLLAFVRNPVTVTFAAVTLVTVLAFALSYSGLHGAAISVGMQPWAAAIFPLLIDLTVAVAYAGTFVLTVNWAKVYAWAVLVLYAGLSIAGNSWRDLPAERVHQVAYAVAPVSMVLALHLGLLVRQARKETVTVPRKRTTTPEEPTAPTPTPDRPARQGNVSPIRRPNTGSSGRNTPLERHQRWVATLPDDLRIALASGADAPTLHRMMTERGYLKDNLSRRRASQRWVEKRDHVFGTAAEASA